MAEKKKYKKRGNPYKRGKTWTFRYYMPDPTTDKKITRTKGWFKTKKEAALIMEETKAKIILGQYSYDKNTTLGLYLSNWYEKVHFPTLKANTINGHRNNYKNHIIPTLGHIPLCKLTRHDVQNFFRNLHQEKKLKSATICYVRTTLNMALKEAVYDGLIYKNPCENIRLPKGEKYRPKVLSLEEMKNILELSKESNVEIEILLAMTLGLRKGEILALQFGDCDFERNTITISRQITMIHDKESDFYKNEKSSWGISSLKTENGYRVLQTPKSVMDSIKKQKEKFELLGSIPVEDDDFICSNNGKHLNPQTVYHRFKKILKLNNLPDIRFHDMRHSCATALIELGIPLIAISYILGHSSIKVTGDIYCHANNMCDQAANAIQTALF